jgi:hypothetical protein
LPSATDSARAFRLAERLLLAAAGEGETGEAENEEG